MGRKRGGGTGVTEFITSRRACAKRVTETDEVKDAERR